MLNKKEEGIDHDYITVGDVFNPTPQVVLVDEDCGDQQQEDVWGTVWAEATIVPGGGHNHDASPGCGEDEQGHVATLGLHHPNVENVTLDGPATCNGDDNDVAAEASIATSTNPNTSRISTGDAPLENNMATLPSGTQKPCKNVLDTTIGSSFAIASVSTTFGLEVAAAVIFVLAAGFFHVGETLRHSGSCLLYLFFGIFTVVFVALLLTDTILLGVSVLLSEILGLVCYSLIVILGGPHLATGWKRYIRKMSHLTRCAFRSFHKDWKVKRNVVQLWEGKEREATS